MTLASSLAALKSSLDQGNEQFTNKHFRLIIEALEQLANGGTGDVTGVGWLTLLSPVTLTIASGVVTPTQSYHAIDTEAAAATDDVDTINGAPGGSLLLLKSLSNLRTVVLKDGTGNLHLAGDFAMNSNRDSIALVSGGSIWIEISRSDNA